MGEIWIPEAIRLGDGVIGGAMDTPKLPPRAVDHTTEGSAGTRAAFFDTANYLIEKASEPHLLYDPITDMLGQFGPLNLSARALRNDGDLRTNRTGLVCIQTEYMAKASKPFTGYWRPGPNYRAMMRAIRSWGVPDVYPAGRLSRTGSDDVPRSRTVWTTKGGHYGHCQVPGNDHWDPGDLDIAALFSAASVPTAPPVTPPTPTPPRRRRPRVYRAIGA
ncbi:hypothetical protein [Streptomyces sp. NPDC001194]|uniref:hypothetical protein n=1 Tax=Streptomyces sp. NPDC001194 TaxID=3364547 RepID=UPI0036C32122